MDKLNLEAELSDAVIAGIMGWRGPGAYTAATLRKIREVIAADRRARAAVEADRSQQGEPVAWAVVSAKGGIHKLAITKDSAARKAARWQEEWPNNGCTVRPLVFGDVRTPVSGTPTSDCTCPSGDGSLRWPCPAHPSEAKAGEDE